MCLITTDASEMGGDKLGWQGIATASDLLAHQSQDFGQVFQRYHRGTQAF